MQTSILERHPSAHLRVYTVWLPMLWGDSRSAWDSGVMPDTRVTHFWDGERVIGQWFSEQVDGDEGIAWDAYYLYGPTATWETIPSHLVSTGRTIIGQSETLEEEILLLQR